MRAMFSCRLSRSLIATAITFAAACADYEDPAAPEELGEPAESASNDAEAAPSTGMVTAPSQATPDAGTPSPTDASVRNEADASVRNEADASAVDSDAGRGAPGQDAGNGRADAGPRERDAGTQVDASAPGDACASLSYATFGMQFMATYCVGCHNGPSAKHGVQLDTLAGVQKNKAAVKKQTVTGTGMPSVDPKPSAADRQKLGQWLDCGAN